eukprot:gene19881-26583_t
MSPYPLEVRKNKDMLDLREDPYGATHNKDMLEVREDPYGATHVPNLLYVKVKNCTAVLQLIAKGNKNRAVRHTEMNQSSSRSHAILQLVIEQWPGGGAAGKMIRSKINFVDLAGSERWSMKNEMNVSLLCEMDISVLNINYVDVARSERWSMKNEMNRSLLYVMDISVLKINVVDVAGSDRRSMKNEMNADHVSELTAINSSLSALANVVSALTEKRQHVPYRNSKLTHLLQDSLGGNCCTTIIATLSPSVDAFDESCSTLKFADRVSCIDNNPVVNTSRDMESVLAIKEKEIQRLRQMVSQLASGVNVGQVDSPETRDQLEELRKALEMERSLRTDLEQKLQAASTGLLTSMLPGIRSLTGVSMSGIDMNSMQGSAPPSPSHLPQIPTLQPRSGSGLPPTPPHYSHVPTFQPRASNGLPPTPPHYSQPSPGGTRLPSIDALDPGSSPTQLSIVLPQSRLPNSSISPSSALPSTHSAAGLAAPHKGGQANQTRKTKKGSVNGSRSGSSVYGHGSVPSSSGGYGPPPSSSGGHASSPAIPPSYQDLLNSRRYQNELGSQDRRHSEAASPSHRIRQGPPAVAYKSGYNVEMVLAGVAAMDSAHVAKPNAGPTVPRGSSLESAIAALRSQARMASNIPLVRNPAKDRGIHSSYGAGVVSPLTAAVGKKKKSKQRQKNLPPANPNFSSATLPLPRSAQGQHVDPDLLALQQRHIVGHTQQPANHPGDDDNGRAEASYSLMSSESSAQSKSKSPKVKAKSPKAKPKKKPVVESEEESEEETDSGEDSDSEDETDSEEESESEKETESESEDEEVEVEKKKKKSSIKSPKKSVQPPKQSIASSAVTVDSESEEEVVALKTKKKSSRKSPKKSGQPPKVPLAFAVTVESESEEEEEVVAVKTKKKSSRKSPKKSGQSPKESIASSAALVAQAPPPPGTSSQLPPSQGSSAPSTPPPPTVGWGRAAFLRQVAAATPPPAADPPPMTETQRLVNDLLSQAVGVKATEMPPIKFPPTFPPSSHPTSSSHSYTNSTASTRKPRSRGAHLDQASMIYVLGANASSVKAKALSRSTKRRQVFE